MNLNIREIENSMLYKNQPRPQTRVVSEIQEIQEIQEIEQQQNLYKTQPVKKNKVTYDDILSSLHMKVINGKLQFTRTDEAAIDDLKKKTVKMQPTNYSNQIKMAPKTLKNHHLPIPHEYVDEEEMDRPTTKQEALIKLINARQEAERINQIKSRKLLFSSNHINIAPTIAPTMSNMFFKFK
jgi:hypothetical protein